MWIFWCFIVYYSFLFLNLLNFLFGWFRFLDEIFLLAAAGEALLTLLEALASDMDRVLKIFVVAVGTLVDDLPHDLIAEWQHGAFVYRGLWFLSVEEDLVGRGHRIDEDDLARPEGIVLALSEHHFPHLVLHRTITLVGIIAIIFKGKSLQQIRPFA
jgi:hypothetical protein